MARLVLKLLVRALLLLIPYASLCSFLDSETETFVIVETRTTGHWLCKGVSDNDKSRSKAKSLSLAAESNKGSYGSSFTWPLPCTDPTVPLGICTDVGDQGAIALSQTQNIFIMALLMINVHLVLFVFSRNLDSISHVLFFLCRFAGYGYGSIHVLYKLFSVANFETHQLNSSTIKDQKR